MKKEIFSIGEVAKLKGFTVKALRFYDRIDLLKPFMVDKYSNYRYYHVYQFILLDIIKAARTLDISPNELVPYFRSKDTSGLFQLLKKHRECAVEKIKQLERIIRSIDELENNTASAEAAYSEKSVTTRFLPVRHVLAIPWDAGKTEEDTLLEYSNLYILADRLGVLPTYTEGVLLRICDGQPVPSHLFITVEGPADSDSYIRIPGGKYICVSYSMEDIEEQQLKLNEYLTENRMVPLEMLQVSLMTDFFNEAEHFELQVRVE